MCDGHKVFRHELKAREHTHCCTVFMHQNKTFYVRLSRKSKNDTRRNESPLPGLVKVNISGATEAFARWERVVPPTFKRPEFDSCFRKVHHQRLRILYHKICPNKHQKRRISPFSWSVGRILERLYRCFYPVCFKSCSEISFFKFINLNNYFPGGKKAQSIATFI